MMMITRSLFCFLVFLCLLSTINGLLSPKGVNFEGNLLLSFNFQSHSLQTKFYDLCVCLLFLDLS